MRANFNMSQASLLKLVLNVGVYVFKLVTIAIVVLRHPQGFTSIRFFAQLDSVEQLRIS